MYGYFRFSYRVSIIRFNYRLQKNFYENSSAQIEDQIANLTAEIKKLKEIGELEKKTNAQLEVQVTELEAQLSSKDKDIDKEIKSKAEIEKLKQKIKDLQTYIDEVEKNYQTKIEECTKEKGNERCCVEALNTNLLAFQII